MFKNLRERYYTTKLIKEAVDTYPDGICFAYRDGRSILTNPKINEVCYTLTGQTITNANLMWENIKKCGGSDTPSGELESDPESPVIRILPDGTVWQFQRTVIHVGETEVIQYTASNITEIYRYQEQLRENIERVSGLHERRRTLLQNIVQNNLNEELLSAKIRIHDSFGQILILTQTTIAGDCAAEDAHSLFAAWNNVITDMENASISSVKKGDSPDKELIRIANMIGCEVEIRGEPPQERAALLLMYAAVREALTNAVRHAGADRLYVDVRCMGGRYFVTITSNGKHTSAEVREGSGLSGLRQRIEIKGGTMVMRTTPEKGVIMEVIIPGQQP